MSVPAVLNSQPTERSFVPDWVKDAVFYQIFPERFGNGDPSNDPAGTEPWGGEPTPKNYFGGDLEGIIKNLDYISRLGVNALYLNPIFESNCNHKYHAKDFFAIDPHFGDDNIFRRFVNECHVRGIRVILDGVWNHTGIDFFAFEDIKKNGADSKYLGWFNIYGLPIGPVNKPNYECWWGYGDLPKLMTHNPDVRNHLFAATEKWMKFGIDGWRLDVPNEIPHQFWVDWRKHVKELNPDAYIVGEIWDDATPWLKGDQFDAVMNYRFRKAAIDFFVEQTSTANDLHRALASVREDYPYDVRYALQNLLGSHDTERFLTLLNGDPAPMRLAWLLQMTYVGAPMVYYGDEIGMTGGKDPGCRRTMEWDQAKQNSDLLTTLSSLIGIRNSYASLRRGSFMPLNLRDEKVFAFRREFEGEQTFVVINNQHKKVSVNLADVLNDFPTWKQIWPASGEEKPGKVLDLPPMSGRVFVRESD